MVVGEGMPGALYCVSSPTYAAIHLSELAFSTVVSMRDRLAEQAHGEGNQDEPHRDRHHRRHEKITSAAHPQLLVHRRT